MFSGKNSLEFQEMIPHPGDCRIYRTLGPWSMASSVTALSHYVSVSVDTEHDRQEAEAIMAKDKFYLQYGLKS